MAQKKTARQVGLARALSKLGYCSRSQAVKLIRDGRVRLNGTTPRNPEAPVRLGADRIEVDDQALKPEAKVYLMLNKPRGAVTTASDEKGRETVYAYLPAGLPWVAPVGRLDKASEGLLLLTNDSEWAARISAPETHLDKTYHVQVQRRLRRGFSRRYEERRASEGWRGAAREERSRFCAGASETHGSRSCWTQGRTARFAACWKAEGMKVLRLVRVSIGPLALGELPKGSLPRAFERAKSRLSTSR